jgi:hypothetical protein
LRSRVTASKVVNPHEFWPGMDSDAIGGRLSAQAKNTGKTRNEAEEE